MNLYPVIQKWYSALTCLNRFDSEHSFFDNISSIDTFFEEYRNITFVSQKLLANTEYMEIYIQKRDEYLKKHNWMVAKRNEIEKEHPFKLRKEIEINIYFPSESFNIYKNVFQIENDKTIEDIKKETMCYFNSIDSNEIYFSIKYKFYDDEGNDIFEKIIDGLVAMKEFIDTIAEEIDSKNETNKDLLKKCDELYTESLARPLSSICDYVYIKDEDRYIVGSRMVMLLGEENVTKIERRPFRKFPNLQDKDDFYNFSFMHAIIAEKGICPAVFIKYNDETYEIHACDSDIKTTFYREIAETADLITTDNSIVEIFYTQIFVQYNLHKGTKSEHLGCIRITKDLITEEYSFDIEKINNMQYVNFTLENNRKEKLECGCEIMRPILKAFEKKR